MIFGRIINPNLSLRAHSAKQSGVSQRDRTASFLAATCGRDVIASVLSEAIPGCFVPRSDIRTRCHCERTLRSNLGCRRETGLLRSSQRHTDEMSLRAHSAKQSGVSQRDRAASFLAATCGRDVLASVLSEAIARLLRSSQRHADEMSLRAY